MTDFDRLLESKINEKMSPILKEIGELKLLICNTSKKEYLSANEVRDVYGISRSTLSRLANKGKVTKHYLGGKTLYSPREISAIINP